MSSDTTGALGVSGTVVISSATRAYRHSLDILDVSQYKPLSLIDGFKPCKSCREYVEQDCTEALPAFQPFSKALVHFGSEVCSRLDPLFNFVVCPLIVVGTIFIFLCRIQSVFFVISIHCYCFQIASRIINQNQTSGLGPQHVLALVSHIFRT